MNKQTKNCGNLGDRLKHSALLQLLNLVSAKARKGVLYVDTHCFLIEAAPADPIEWLNTVAEESLRHPSFNMYVRAERPYFVECGRYRCSVGLAIDHLRGRPARWVLAESDPETRQKLEAQLAEEGVCPHALLSDACELAQVVPLTDCDVMFALVDPFVLDSGVWVDVSRGLGRLCEAVEVAIVEVFTFQKRSKPMEWPAAPAGLAGPVCTVSVGPYHLAVYASASMAHDACARCLELGWVGAPQPNR
jgi:hypothetical protein